MIVRDALRSDERHVVGPIEMPLDEAPTVVVPALTIVEPVPLTTDQVLEWLDVQPATVREQVASGLATELHALGRAAHAEGYSAGEASGGREVLERHAAALELLEAIATASGEALGRTSKQVTDQCALIVAEAFARIAGEALVLPAAARGAVQAALTRITHTRHLTVVVAPRDFTLLEQERESLQAALGTTKLELASDPDLTLGGCRVESHVGTLDASFEVQLRGLYNLLRDAYEADRSAS